MGIRNSEGEICNYCPICGLSISKSEYVLMKIEEKDMTYNYRKIHCNQYHTELIQLYKKDQYNYEWAFKKSVSTV